MKNWSSPAITNVLLLINAVLLFILVANSSNSSRRPHGRSELSDMGAPPMASNFHGTENPHENFDSSDDSDSPAQPQGGFNFNNMVNAALKCPSDATITLADAGCKGSETKKRRDFVKDLGTQNLPPRMMFDKIIEKFGEGALTDEALEIRKNNRR